jgi:hypothetical protein
MSTSINQWKNGPFGNTDAARVELSDFIAIAGILEDPRNNPDAMQDRVIIGRKGSGKTLYLRKLLDEAKKRDFITLSEYDTLSSETVVYFLKRIREYVQSMDRIGDFDIFVNRRNTVISVWRSIWERAMFVSAISLVLSYKRKSKIREISPALDIRGIKNIDELEIFLINSFSELFSVPLHPISPQLALRSFSDHFDTSRRLQKFLNDSRWVDVQSIAKAIVTDVPPIAIYVDAIDDDFEDAPEAWLTCQLGLYRAVSQSGFTNESFSGRVHVVVALRDIVYSASLRSEHSTRHFQNRHIKIIDWDTQAIKSFFLEKLRSISKTNLRLSNQLEPLIQDWVGFSKMTNGRLKEEGVADYVLRHGRMLPRDIVLFGNAIATEKSKRIAAAKPFESKSLRKCVSEAAAVVGAETVSICVNEMLSNADHFSDYLLGVGTRPVYYQDFRRYLEAKIRRFFTEAKNEVISKQEFHDAIVLAGLGSKEEFDDNEDPYYRLDNLFWRHGLIAYEETNGAVKKWRYNWKGTASSDLIPARAVRFGFHACLIDVYGITPSPDGPVY